MTVTPALTSPDGGGFHIQWGPESYNVGLNDVFFTAQDVASVPEPATLLLLGSGLAGLVRFARRSKS